MGKRLCWRGPQLQHAGWKSIGASDALLRAIMFGIVDPPTVPFTEREIMAELPQSEKDKTFARHDLENGCNEGIYEEVSGGEAERLVST